MKGIRPILFLLVTVLLVGLSTSVSIAYATEDSATIDCPGGIPSTGAGEGTVDGEDPGQGEGDPDHYGDGNEKQVDGLGDEFDGVIIEDYLLQLLTQVKLLVL